MNKITFENSPSTKTPINAANLNLMQNNIEAAIENSLIEGTLTVQEGFELSRISLVKDTSTKIVYLNAFVTALTPMQQGSSYTPFTIPSGFRPKSDYVYAGIATEGPFGCGSCVVARANGIMNIRPATGSATKAGICISYLSD